MSALDPDRLEKLIGRHQLTYLQVAELLGIDVLDLRLALPTRRLPTSALMRLAQLLGESPLQTTTRPHRRDTDRTRLGALLASHPEGLTRDDLAHSLRWPLDRLERALQALDAALKPLGMRLVATDRKVHVAGQLQHVPARARRQAAAANLTVTAELARALRNTHVHLYKAGETTPNLESALRLGILEPAPGPSRKLRLTPAVRFSLCLDRARPPDPATTESSESSGTPGGATATAQPLSEP